MIVDSQCHHHYGGGNGTAEIECCNYSGNFVDPGGGGGGGNNNGQGGGCGGQTSFYPNPGSNFSSSYQPTPSPADSGVMSPMTPLSSYTNGSTPEQSGNGLMTSPEHLGAGTTTSSTCSPFHGHPSPADSGFHLPSPFPMTSPNLEDQCCGIQFEQCNNAWTTTAATTTTTQQQQQLQMQNVSVFC